MKHKILLGSLAAALLAGGFTATPTFAADRPAARGKALQHITQKLELTDSQKTEIKAVFAGEKAALKPLIRQLHEARANLRQAIHAGDANETSVRAAATKVAAVESDLAVKRLKLYGKISPILTAAQREKLSAMEQKLDELMDNAIARGGQGRKF